VSELSQPRLIQEDLQPQRLHTNRIYPGFLEVNRAAMQPDKKAATCKSDRSSGNPVTHVAIATLYNHFHTVPGCPRLLALRQPDKKCSHSVK
jgi:hypothetical protein